MTDPIAMWSGPRNLSTAMMYAFAARGDCAVVDEPFYGAYLKATGIAASDGGRGDCLAEPRPRCRSRPPASGQFRKAEPLFYQKHMTLHMIPTFPRGFMRGLTNVFLIRHPARVVASYAKKREAPTLADIGFVQQAELFDEVADWLGHAPPVIDSADIRANPAGALSGLCRGTWHPLHRHACCTGPPGPRPYDGVWAPHWYNAVHKSTGFDGP